MLFLERLEESLDLKKKAEIDQSWRQQRVSKNKAVEEGADWKVYKLLEKIDALVSQTVLDLELREYEDSFEDRTDNLDTTIQKSRKGSRMMRSAKSQFENRVRLLAQEIKALEYQTRENPHRTTESLKREARKVACTIDSDFSYAQAVNYLRELKGAEVAEEQPTTQRYGLLEKRLYQGERLFDLLFEGNTPTFEEFQSLRDTQIELDKYRNQKPRYHHAQTNCNPRKGKRSYQNPSGQRLREIVLSPTLMPANVTALLGGATHSGYSDAAPCNHVNSICF